MQIIGTATDVCTRFPPSVVRLPHRRPSETALGLLGHLLRGLQEYVIRKDNQILTDPFPAYDAALIHEEERPSCYPTF